MKMSAIDTHNQLHGMLHGEEVITLDNGKGDIATYKLNHEHKQVLIGGGPEEDCLWKHTNASYAAVLSNLGRSADNTQPAIPGLVEAVPVESGLPE